MKILVVSSLAADTGSSVRAAFLARALQGAGLKVEFVKPLSQTLPLKIDFLISLPWYFLKIIFTPCDFVLAVKSYPNVGIPLFFKKLFRGKIIIDTDDLSFAYSDGLWSLLSKLSQELFLPLAVLHTYHNPNLLNYLKNDLKIPEQKTFQVKQGTNLETYKKTSKKKLGFEKYKILLFVGHFDNACDLEPILKAMPPVFKKIPLSRLLIIGDGPLKRKFELTADKLGISEKIVWRGLLPNREVMGFINIADVCLVYYKVKKANKYRSSLKLREYLSLGKKVVCNNFGELADFADYTYQSTAGPEDFSQNIVKVLSGFTDRRELRGKEYIIRNYLWGGIGRDLADKLRSI